MQIIIKKNKFVKTLIENYIEETKKRSNADIMD